MFPSLQPLGADLDVALRSCQVQNEVDRLVLQQFIHTLDLQSKLFSPFLGICLLRVGAAYDGQFRKVFRRLQLSGADVSGSDNANTDWSAHA